MTDLPETPYAVPHYATTFSALLTVRFAALLLIGAVHAGAAAAQPSPAPAASPAAAVPLSAQVMNARTAGKLEQFIPQLRQQAQDPKNWNGYLLLGDALRDLGENSGAFLAYQDAFRMSAPDEKQTLRFRLQVIDRLLDLGQVDAASRPLDAIASRAQELGDGALLIGLGETQERLGNRRMAEDLSARGEMKAGSRSGAYAAERRARRLLDTGDFQACAAVVQTSISSDMTSPVRELLGVYGVLALVEQGRQDEARKAAAQIAWAPRSGDDQRYLLRYLRVARALGITESIRAAVRQLDQVIAASAKQSKYVRPDAEVLMELALAHRDLGDQASSKQCAEEVLKIVPDASLPLFQFLRGRAARIIGDEVAATSCLTKALALDTANHWIKKELAAKK